MKRACSLAILVLVSSATAQTVQTSVCEVGQSPASFDGKMVRLRATVASGFETGNSRSRGRDLLQAAACRTRPAALAGRRRALARRP